MLTLHLASGNAHKVEEFRRLAVATDLAVDIVSAQVGGGMPVVDEDTGTFVGNARKKARALQACRPAGTWVLADDSGLCVDALSGAPGVESAYFAGPAGDAAANLNKLIALMKDVPVDQRSAHFICVLVLLDADGTEHILEGRCDGRLAMAPRSGGGFGYDPLFMPAGHEQTFAELADGLKEQLSHRARAWAHLAAWLRSGNRSQHA